MRLNKVLVLFIFGLLSNICFARIFYIDPANGSDSGDGSISSPWKTLEYVINNNLVESAAYITQYDSHNPQTEPKNTGAPVKAGDTLMLYGGLHGDIFIQNYINPSYITIKAVPGQTPILKKCHLRSAKNWRFEGLSISSEPYGTYIGDVLFYLESHNWHGPVSDIEIKDCMIYSTANAWTTAEDWVSKGSNGILVNASRVLLQNNTLTNIRLGISLSGDNNRAIGNSVINFAGDGLRILGSSNLVESNLIKNCYSVDDNHDDGIQSFTTGGLIVDNNIVRGNTILNYEDPHQPLLGSLQGIGCFDGPYNNWVVENNLVVVDHWHGITFYEGINCRIINNTVLDPTPSSSNGPSWISIGERNSGSPSSNCVVKNNIANAVNIHASSNNTTVGNNILLQSVNEYNSHFVDFANFDFRLIQGSGAIDHADMNYSSMIDINGMARPWGRASDIGAYEFLGETVSIDPISTKMEVLASEGTLSIQSDKSLGMVSIHTMNGQCIYRKLSNAYGLYISDLPKELLIVSAGGQIRKVLMR